ncbi:MAG: hypothetical protein ACRC6K_03020 [Fusobacteriaceae bacterium]
MRIEFIKELIEIYGGKVTFGELKFILEKKNMNKITLQKLN